MQASKNVEVEFGGETFEVALPAAAADAQVCSRICAELGLPSTAQLQLPAPAARAPGATWHIGPPTFKAQQAGDAPVPVDMRTLRSAIASLELELAGMREQLRKGEAQAKAAPPASPHQHTGANPNSASPECSSPTPLAPAATPLDTPVSVLSAPPATLTAAATTLRELIAGRYAVLDFWTTK